MSERMMSKYPTVEIDCPSLSDVRCLMDSYGGESSETTAIMQYMYQAYILKEIDYELYKTIENIAIQEMTHHELLGETIVKLGGTPVIGGYRQFWNGAMVNYTKDIMSILDANIKGETIAIENYKKAIKCVDNYSIKELLEAIISDEKEHLKTFYELKEHFKNKK